jgi:hypothetical protein
VLLLVLLLVGLGLLLTRCPANRDGMPGQLAKAMDETTAAARSDAYALELFTHRRSTTQLTSVQLSDAHSSDHPRGHHGAAARQRLRRSDFIG